MTGKSFPWNSEVGNERYFDATDFSTVFSAMYSNGVFYMKGEGNLKVEPSSGMTIKVNPGISNLNGTFYYDKEDKFLTITPVSSSSQSRIDNIVVKYNEDEKEAEILVIEGTNSESPTPPTKESDEFVLARVTVRGASTSIINSDITDTRGDQNLCGFVTATRPELPDNIVEALEASLEEKANKSGDTFTGRTHFDNGITVNGAVAVFNEIPRIKLGDVLNMSDLRDLTSKGYVDNRVVAGIVTVSIAAVNTPTYHSIGDYGPNSCIVSSGQTSSPQVVQTASAKTGANVLGVYVNRTSGTAATAVHYIIHRNGTM